MRCRSATCESDFTAILEALLVLSFPETRKRGRAALPQLLLASRPLKLGIQDSYLGYLSHRSTFVSAYSDMVEEGQCSSSC
jgi:hypothetical protein